MRMAWAWAGAVAVIVGAVAGGVALANTTVFSASGFVRDYLTALSADRIDEVLALPGVLGEDVDSALLTTHAGERFAFEILGEERGDGVHLVRVAFGPSAEHLESRATLAIEQIGTRFLLFPRWGFAISPLTTVTVELSGDGRFTVGERPVASDAPEVEITLFRPGIYRLGHESAFLEARGVEVHAARPTESASLSIRPTDRFRDAVDDALDELLDSCTEQAVLFPIGCPFGTAVADRVISEPAWSIATLPTVTIEPGDELGLWRVARFAGAARLAVEVQDLYDGSLDTDERDVPFEAAYDVTFDGDRVVLLPR
ncbi:hypothetical protein [Salinibacterium sp. ZJ77]|uniref:hypothetical protein n=1 Tax=Salinibacterium sp. ZJ77 TaxID=2708337 RepID=UPI001421CA16|nr:hypothetical protein [Salinibacterium sp. ZJ77]